MAYVEGVLHSQNRNADFHSRVSSPPTEIDDIDTLADGVMAIIGRDSVFFRDGTSDDIADLLNDMAGATDPAADDTDHAWRVSETADSYHHACTSDRERVLQEIRRRIEHELVAKFIARWKDTKV